MEKGSKEKTINGCFGSGTDLTVRWNGACSSGGHGFSATAMAVVRQTEADVISAVCADRSGSGSPHGPVTVKNARDAEAALMSFLDGILNEYTDSAAPVMNGFADVCEYKFREYCKNIGLETVFFSADGWEDDEDLPF